MRALATQPAVAIRDFLARQVIARAAALANLDSQTLYKAATQAIDDAGNDPGLMIILGDRALARGDYAIAHRCFGRAAELDDKNLDALEGLALSLAAAEQHKQAIPIYRRIIELTAPAAQSSTASKPSSPGPREIVNRTARYNLAVALSRIGESLDAMGEYRALVERYPDFVEAGFNLAALYQANGHLLQAARQWEDVLQHADSMAKADAAAGYTMLGQARMDLGKPAEAMDAYSRAAKLMPQDADAWLNFGAAARAAGKYGHAVTAVRRAADLRPKSDDVWARLGELLIEMHRLDGRRDLLAEGVGAWRKSLDLNPNQPALRKTLQRYEEALETTTTAPDGL